MKTELVSIESLTLDPKNARAHDTRNLDAIAKSLQEFGFQKPIVVDANGLVIAGNGTVCAAKKLGWTQIPIVRTELVGAQAKAYAIADNRTAELATWDDGMLASVLSEIQIEGLDVEITGFTNEEMDRIIAQATGAAEIEEDEVPEPPANPVTQPGDIWQLGRHRLICGDSTEEATVARLLNGAKPGMMVTDPPYGVNYDPEWRDEAAAKGLLRWGAGKATGKVSNDDRADWSSAYRLFEGKVAYTWSPPGDHVLVTGTALQSVGFTIRAMIMWRKAHFAISRGAYHYQHEPCWYAVRKGSKANWIGDRSQSTVWDVKNDKNEGGHGTQKPLECMARPMRNHDVKDIYDPFLGSGTTLIAAEQLGRTCYGLEIDPAYCDVVVERWQNLTGEKATRS